MSADLSFLDASFQHLGLWLNSISDMDDKTIHVVHTVYLPSEAVRDAFKQAVDSQRPDARLTYENVFPDDDELPHWLEYHEPVAADEAAIRYRVGQMVALAHAHHGEYQEFELLLQSPNIDYLLVPSDIDPADYAGE